MNGKLLRYNKHYPPSLLKPARVHHCSLYFAKGIISSHQRFKLSTTQMSDELLCIARSQSKLNAHSILEFTLTFRQR